MIIRMKLKFLSSSQVFQGHGRLIGMLWVRVGKEEGDILTVVFLGTWLGTVIWRNSKK